MPIFAFFHNSTKISKRFSGVIAPNITEFAYNVAIFNALLSCPLAFDIPIHFGMAVRQRKFFGKKNTDFANVISCHGNVP